MTFDVRPCLTMRQPEAIFGSKEGPRKAAPPGHITGDA